MQEEEGARLGWGTVRGTWLNLVGSGEDVDELVRENHRAGPGEGNQTLGWLRWLEVSQKVLVGDCK